MMSKPDDGFYKDLLDEFEELVDEANEGPSGNLLNEDDLCCCDCCREKVMQCDGDPVEKEYAVSISVGVDMDFIAYGKDEAAAEELALEMFNHMGLEQALKESDCYATSEPDVMASWEVKE